MATSDSASDGGGGGGGVGWLGEGPSSIPCAICPDLRFQMADKNICSVPAGLIRGTPRRYSTVDHPATTRIAHSVSATTEDSRGRARPHCTRRVVSFILHHICPPPPNHRPHTLPPAMESTLALVKPHAFPRADEILSAITSAGFTITAKDVLSLNTTRAAAFYAAHPPPAGAGASSPPVPVADLIGALTAGPVMALVVSKAGGGVNDELASLAGPEDPATARTAAPGSLRARFGVDAAKNAVHVVAPGADAEAQVAFFFPERERELPSGAAAKEYLMGSVVPSLTKGLTELCRVAPADPLGWLSTFLGDAAREARGGDASADAEAEAAKGAEANGEAKKDKQKIVFVLGGPGSGKVRLEARLWVVGMAMRGRGASRCDSERQLVECGSSRPQLATEACLWLTRVALGKTVWVCTLCPC